MLRKLRSMAYLGFNKLQGKIESEGKSPAEAGAIAGAIGRKKYGKAAMARAAKTRSKLGGKRK